MSSIALWMLLSLQPATGPAIGNGPPGTITVQRSLTIPDEIAPAMIIYLNCLTSSQGVPLINERGEAMERVVPKGGDCTAHRKEAADKADWMLREYTNRSRKERRQLIENTLDSLDESMPRYPERPPVAKPHAQD
jgi:hypothetical protein